jgi:hypothetical protein
MSFHDDLVARLEYFDGHSDTLGLFADGEFLRDAAVAHPVASVALADELRG